MRWVFPVLLILVSAECGARQKEAAKVLGFKTATFEKKIPLAELKTRFGEVSVTVDDYYLRRPMRYQAIPLSALLRAWASEAPGYDELIFRCADGYLAHVSRADFEAGKLNAFFLAFGQSLGAESPTADSFQVKIPQGKAEISPEPFYAVSTDKAGFSTLSWPYELMQIEFVNFGQMFPKLMFAGLEKNPQLKKGFDLFRGQCLKCHSLNLQGGDIGPELNIPRNITEYRDGAYLRAFIRDASGYRAKSKMPPFASLSTDEMNAIISYLKQMAAHKVGQP